MNQHYNQNYTRELIDAVLDQIKACVKEKRFTISKNEHRQENIDFINEYNTQKRSAGFDSYENQDGRFLPFILESEEALL